MAPSHKTQAQTKQSNPPKTHIPLVPKALLYGCDKSAGTFPGDVGGVVIPQTVDGLQRLVYKANQNVSITREHQVLHQVSSQCSV